ncbi:hypothetical protein DM860_000230 [Cuscuta australis]|uniref:Uncharacterized protein n=1 Tax=Cuscuta australis TaxID=267555 RepID=A0A328CWS6_9ASTE|nr:hypothetical protein DM860_000230 [Cuscuta australis]
MEDRNALVADCIVVSCCCQCLLLQLVVFILLKLPSGMIRRAKRYVKNLRTRNREGKGLQVKTRYGEEEDESMKRSQIHHVDAFFSFSGSCCMDEVERVLDELSQNGEFAFGSFWGRYDIVCSWSSPDEFVFEQLPRGVLDEFVYSKPSSHHFFNVRTPKEGGHGEFPIQTQTFANVPQ